ncbi:MAG: hypothetical protein JW902_16840 [Syntrophaceae bacterium]|nr:hypothetical protein [Syntrophaceae bacterium]
MFKQRLKEIAPDTNQGRLFLRIAGALVALAAGCHLIMGAGFASVLFCAAAIILSLLPLAYLGPLNIAAVLVALVGFRYVGFPLFAKLAMGQALDTYLLDPTGAFGVVLVGVLGYGIALIISSRLPLGRPLLAPVSNHVTLGRISFLAAVVGITANMAVAFRSGDVYTGITVASFFVPFLHLALIAAIARTLVASNQKRSVDGWVIVVLIAEIAFVMSRNSRMALLEIVLCFVVTVSAFKYKIRWRQFFLITTFITVMVVFITPVFLYVRGFRGDLSWTGRIGTTIEAFGKWPDAFSEFLSRRDTQDRMGWFLNYYGIPQNTFERMSLINHIDVIKASLGSRGEIGVEDLLTGVERALPRALAPNKPRGYSQGGWLYYHIGVHSVMGGYATVPLIGSGYAAFGRKGSFFYPLILGMLWLLVVRKISGFDLRGNIWAIYLLLRVHNQFVEGSSDSYLVHILRVMPQDFILLWLVDLLGTGRFPFRLRNRGSRIYDK